MRYNRDMTSRRKERYERLNLPDDGEGDASQYGYPTIAEAPWDGYDSAWQVFARMAEAAVGRVFNFGGSNMQLVRDENRRAIGVRNALTGKVRWVSMDVGFFGADQVQDEVDLGDYMEAGIAQWDTPLGRTLQKDSARAPRRSVKEEWVKRGADPNHRSIFKPKFERGRRVT